MAFQRSDQYNGNSSALHNNALERAKVSLVRAYDYELDQIHPALEKAIDLIGGIQKIFKPGAKVFVKINHLSPPSPAERGIVTHPVFVEAVLKLLKECGADITVGDDVDSSNGDAFEVSGFRQSCQRAGVKLVNLRDTGFIETKCEGTIFDRLFISKEVLEAEVIINLPKLKTHSLTVITGGIKNMYGTIPKGFRTRFHYQYLKRVDFCQLLTDIFSVVRPQLTVMDGILAMEGEGPASGKLRRLGVILASQDTVALDTVASKIIGLEPMTVHTTKHAYKRGLGVGDLQHIEIVGENLNDVVSSDFKLSSASGNIYREHLPRVLSKLLARYLSTKQQVLNSQCTGCNECKNVCPAGAISMNGKIAIISQSKCINCMCCHEVCRFGAIVPRRTFARRTLDFATRILKS